MTNHKVFYYTNIEAEKKTKMSHKGDKHLMNFGEKWGYMKSSFLSINK